MDTVTNISFLLFLFNQKIYIYIASLPLDQEGTNVGKETLLLVQLSGAAHQTHYHQWSYTETGDTSILAGLFETHFLKVFSKMSN